MQDFFFELPSRPFYSLKIDYLIHKKDCNIAQKIINLDHDQDFNEHCIGVTEIFFDGTFRIRFDNDSEFPCSNAPFLGDE